jgi:hypothetical protein
MVAGIGFQVQPLWSLKLAGAARVMRSWDTLYPRGLNASWMQLPAQNFGRLWLLMLFKTSVSTTCYCDEVSIWPAWARKPDVLFARFPFDSTNPPKVTHPIIRIHWRLLGHQQAELMFDSIPNAHGKRPLITLIPIVHRLNPPRGTCMILHELSATWVGRPTIGEWWTTATCPQSS